MYQIVCWLGLCPIPHWGSLQRSPDPIELVYGVGPPEKGKKGGRQKEGGEGMGGEGVPECPNPELAAYFR